MKSKYLKKNWIKKWYKNDVVYIIVTHYVRKVGGRLNGKAAKVYLVSFGFEPRPLKLFGGRAKKRSDLCSKHLCNKYDFPSGA